MHLLEEEIALKLCGVKNTQVEPLCYVRRHVFFGGGASVENVGFSFSAIAHTKFICSSSFLGRISALHEEQRVNQRLLQRHHVKPKSPAMRVPPQVSAQVYLGSAFGLGLRTWLQGQGAVDVLLDGDAKKLMSW